MPSQQQYEISKDLQEILLDFTVHYLVEQPGDVVDFALEYFNRLHAARRSANATIHSDDESMVSDEETPSNGNLFRTLRFFNNHTRTKAEILGHSVSNSRVILLNDIRNKPRDLQCQNS